MPKEEFEKRLDNVETKIIYITEVLEKNAEVLTNLLEQMNKFDNRVYNDEVILGIQKLVVENVKSINENMKVITEVYGHINDNTESLIELRNQVSGI